MNAGKDKIHVTRNQFVQTLLGPSLVSAETALKGTDRHVKVNRGEHIRHDVWANQTRVKLLWKPARAMTIMKNHYWNCLCNLFVPEISFFIGDLQISFFCKLCVSPKGAHCGNEDSCATCKKLYVNKENIVRVLIQRQFCVNKLFSVSMPMYIFNSSCLCCHIKGTKKR